jgi:hypothetical protein
MRLQSPIAAPADGSRFGLKGVREARLELDEAGAGACRHSYHPPEDRTQD